MTRIKLCDITDEKPVRLTIELTARLHQALLAYAAAMNGGAEQGAPTCQRLIPLMVERFVAADRSFTRSRKAGTKA